MAVLLGCAGTGSLPEVDLDDPGWSVWSGQALWKPGNGRPALAGELLVAQHANDDVLVSFSKPPVPFFTAQTAGGRWRIDFLHRDRRYSGLGRPPDRFVWFHIPAILKGAPPPKSWNVSRRSDDNLVLHQPETGETIRLVFGP